MHLNGYIYSDIRLSNVAYHKSDQSYLLIDFENVQKMDKEHHDDFLINEIQLRNCKCFLRDLIFIWNAICNFSYFPRSDETIQTLLDDLRSILDFKNKGQMNEMKQKTEFI